MSGSWQVKRRKQLLSKLGSEEEVKKYLQKEKDAVKQHGVSNKAIKAHLVVPQNS